MGEFTPQMWILAALSAALVGMSKAGIPGLGIMAAPLMASALQAKASMGVLLPMLIVGDIFAVCYYHRHANWAMLYRLVPTALAGIVVGSVVMHRITDGQLRVVIGLVVFTMVILSILRNRGVIADERIPKGTAAALVTGLVAGVTTMMAHAAGPVMQVYFLTMGLKKNEFIGTGAWFFFLVNVFKLPFYIGLGLVTPASLVLNLKIAAGIPLGIALGILVVGRLSNQSFTYWVQVLTAAAAARLVFG